MRAEILANTNSNTNTTDHYGTNSNTGTEWSEEVIL